MIKNTVLLFFILKISLNSFGITSNKIAFEKSPVLISDTLKKVNRSSLIKSSLNQLDQNIYISSLNAYYFSKTKLSYASSIYTNKYAELEEVLGVNAFYNNNLNEALINFNSVFRNTKDSLQKATTAENLIKLYYLKNDFTIAQAYINYIKKHLLTSYNFKQSYTLLFMEAKIALAMGLTQKAEQITIQQLLPKSKLFGGNLAEFNCYLFLGKVYLKARSLTQAKWFFIQANSLANQQSNLSGKIETYLLLAKAKIIARDKSVALEDLSKARQLINSKNSIYTADLKRLYQLANSK